MKLTKLFILILLSSVFCTSVQAVDKLYDKRFQEWQNKAKKGNAFAQYSLGNAYLRGNEVKTDITKAIYWFMEAAKQGHAKSEYKLGYIYYSGKGIGRNYRTALDWFLAAAKHDYSPAQFYAGKMYADGKGTDADTEKALMWLKKARENDYSPATREIERIASQSSKPAPAPVVEKQKTTITAVKPSTTKKAPAGDSDTKTRIMKGKWLRGGMPAEPLPSEVTQCSEEDDQLICTSQELTVTTLSADIRYLIEAKFTRFTKKGRFLVTWRKNILFVLPSDPDDKDVDPESVPPTGWTQPAIMKCRFTKKNNISCSTDDYLKIEFTRKN